MAASTFTYSAEACGFCAAAASAGVPSVVAFTVETDGRLPSGEKLEEAVNKVDQSGHPPAYMMINCAHFDHFMPTLREGIKKDQGWVKRIQGIRANPSRLSHDELDNCTELQRGDTKEYGSYFGQIREEFPWIKIMGGCCGTNEEHVEQIKRNVIKLP